MRFMSYNILTGGHGELGDRSDKVIDVIRRESPEILALCECNDFLADGEARLAWFKQQLDMEGVLVEATTGFHVGLFWADSIEVKESQTTSSSMFHGLVRLKALVGSKVPVTIVAAHLHPFSSILRMAEAQVVVGKAADAENSIVMGDFNSLSAHDGISEEERLESRLLDSGLHPDTGVIDLLERAGFKDALIECRAAKATTPTRVALKQTMPVRIDYLLAKGPFAGGLTSATVIDTELAHQASDHLPVVADFDIY